MIAPRLAAARILIARAASVLILGAGGCGEERVAYIYRNPLLEANGSPAPKDARLPDGTPIVYIDKPLEQWRAEREAMEAGVTEPTAPAEEIRVEQPDGSVTLRNERAEHLVGNLMTCFRNREWEAIWYQCITRDARDRWERSGGTEAFVEWCEKNRKDIMEFLNRAGFGFLGTDVLLQQTGPGVAAIRFSPRISSQFRVRALAITQGSDGSRLIDVQWNPDFVEDPTGKGRRSPVQSNRP